LGEWLQVLGGEVEKTPVGIAATSSELALATKAQGWLLRADVDPETHARLAGSAGHAVLRKLLTAERTAPALVTRDTGYLITALENWLGDYDRNALLPNIVHDMKVLEYVTGRGIAVGMTALKDALDCAVVGPGMALEAPRFYQQVGMPLARHNAQTHVIYVDPEVPAQAAGAKPWSRWTLTYDYLLFRVLAHYTRDPTMTRWFEEGRSPLQEFSSYLELNSKEATAFLLWMVCGEEEELVSRYYPDWATLMPEAPQLIKASRVDKTLPNLRLGLIRLTDQYAISRKTETLYGRRSPWGLKPQELLHFVIMGSVNDLLDVVVASIIRLGSDAHWLVPEASTKYNHWLRAQVVGYSKEEPMDWQRKLEELGQLNNPLGAVSLEPRVSVEVARRGVDTLRARIKELGGEE
jgi:hypothetical protein